MEILVPLEVRTLDFLFAEHDNANPTETKCRMFRFFDNEKNINRSVGVCLKKSTIVGSLLQKAPTKKLPELIYP